MNLSNTEETKVTKKSRYDFTLAEFPFCLLQDNLELKAGERGRRYYEYKDKIVGKDGELVDRTWRIHAAPEAGFGGRTTLGTIFEIFQIWKEQGFHTRNIRFGTVNNLIERKGIKGTRNTYKATIRDLLFMAGAQYDAINAFWDNEKKAYVTVKYFKFFDFLAHYDKGKRAGQQVLPFGFIRASEILHNAVLSGTLVMDFEREIFHKLTPLEQRLALYGSKVIRSQNIVKRDLLNFARQMTITAKDKKKIRQEFRKAVKGMNEKGLHIFDRVYFEKSSDRKGENIILLRAGNYLLPFKELKKAEGEEGKPDYKIGALVDEIISICRDEKSRDFYSKVAKKMPDQDIFTALSEVKDEYYQGTVNNKGAIFTLKIKRKAKERNIDL